MNLNLNMKLNAIALLATLVTLAAVPVFAQAQAADGSPPPGMRTAREGVQKVCANEPGCAGKGGRELFLCLRQNQDRLSKPCADALAKMPRPQRPAAPPAQ